MKKGYFYIMIATFLFSTMEIAIKLSGNTFNPIELNFLRFLIGGLVLLPLAIKRLQRSKRRLAGRDWLFFSITGFFCIVVSMTFFQLAIQYTKASTVAILFSCNPIFVLAFAALFLREKLSRLTVGSIIISLIGMLVIVNPFELQDPLGIVLAVAAAITFAIYSVICRYGTKERRYDGIVMTCFSFLVGVAELAVVMMLTHIPALAEALNTAGLSTFSQIPFVAGVSLSSLPLLIYLGVFVTGIGFSSYFLAMEETSVSLASLVFFIKPALAPILALLILHEAIYVNTAIGILLILIGSTLTFVASREVPKIIRDKEKEGRIRTHKDF
ncbi:DMT family transporter [Listeria costaricensis]|uniref:DMT family transporter n=1 Tax=Listeria costaricensis TaxID=2026604 RepID=UPI000C087D88|nr:DMT family transporter [Listeria costaricensis]